MGFSPVSFGNSRHGFVHGIHAAIELAEVPVQEVVFADCAYHVAVGAFLDGQTQACADDARFQIDAALRPNLVALLLLFGNNLVERLKALLFGLVLDLLDALEGFIARASGNRLVKGRTKNTANSNMGGAPFPNSKLLKAL